MMSSLVTPSAMKNANPNCASAAAAAATRDIFIMRQVTKIAPTATEAQKALRTDWRTHPPPSRLSGRSVMPRPVNGK